MKTGSRSLMQAARRRTHPERLRRPGKTTVLVLSMLLVGMGSGAGAQTEVAEKPTEIPREVSTPAEAEAPISKAAKESGKRKGPRVTGYIQYHFDQPIDTNNNGAAASRFRIQRARLTLEGKVNERVSYEMDIDPRSPNLTGLMRDAYVDIKLHRHLTVRLGQHKVKFGYVNQRSSSALYVVNRPEMAFDLSRGVNLRDIGASLLGKVPISRGGVHLKYGLSLVNGAGVGVQRDNNKSKNVSGRIGLFNKGDGTQWQLGVSGAVGDIFENSNKPEYDGGWFLDYKRVGTDFLVERRRFAVNGEYAVGKHVEKERNRKETLHGYYVTLVGKTTASMGPMIRYDSMNTRITTGGYYGKPSAPFRLLVNYEKRTGDDRLYLWMLSRF